MNIVFLDAKSTGFKTLASFFNPFGNYVEYASSARSEIIERTQDAEIIIVNKVVLDKDLLSLLPNLRLICVTATGTNNIDLSYTSKHGIEVKNVVNYSSMSVAQHTFGLLLSLLHQICYFNDYIYKGDYSKSDIFTHYSKPIYELNGKKFGIVGLGNIGRSVAKIATAFGANVQYYSTSGNNHQTTYTRLSFDELIRTSDFISIHAPLNERTENLIAWKEMTSMKREVILVNVARGGIIHEGDLARAIDENTIGGACIDVYTSEPPDQSHSLLNVANKNKLLLSPHNAWTSVEARTLLMKKTVENIQKYLAATK